MKNFLIVAPHPDDEIVGLGITIKKLLIKKKKLLFFFLQMELCVKNKCGFGKESVIKI